MSADALLLVGEGGDPRLPKLLNKLGYKVLGGKDCTHVAKTLQENVVDLVVIDGNVEDPLELCRYFKSDAMTREVPIVVLAKDRLDVLHIKEQGWQNVECLVRDSSVGAVVGKIATQLRLSKMAGAENPHASLVQMNAALRDNNDVFRREREQARAIQQALLPGSLPKHDAYDMAIRYQPLDEVGGDWYFVQNLSDGRFAFQMLDVTGHGLSAALIGSMTRLAIAAAQREDPGELLGQVNHLLTPHLPEGRFITMVSSLYEPCGRLSFARAGHPPALLFRRSTCKVEELKPPGFAVGFLDEGKFPAVQTSLAVGDVLVVITDGISEAQDRGKHYFGMEGVSKALAKTSLEHGAAQVVDLVMSEFETFLDGRRVKDDVSLFVLVRRK